MIQSLMKKISIWIKRKTKIVFDFVEILSSELERKIYEYFHSTSKQINSPENQKLSFYLSLIKKKNRNAKHASKGYEDI